MTRTKTTTRSSRSEGAAVAEQKYPSRKPQRKALSRKKIPQCCKSRIGTIKRRFYLPEAERMAEKWGGEIYPCNAAKDRWHVRSKR